MEAGKRLFQLNLMVRVKSTFRKVVLRSVGDGLFTMCEGKLFHRGTTRLGMCACVCCMCKCVCVSMSVQARVVLASLITQ